MNDISPWVARRRKVLADLDRLGVDYSTDGVVYEITTGAGDTVKTMTSGAELYVQGLIDGAAK